MVVAGNDGKIVLVNSQTEKLFGYKREELLGQPVEVLVPERFWKHHHFGAQNKVPSWIHSIVTTAAH